MSLSALALYALARELPRSHRRVTYSFAGVIVAGALLRLTSDQVVSDAGLAAIALSVLGLLLVLSDGLRRRFSFGARSYDRSS